MQAFDSESVHYATDLLSSQELVDDFVVCRTQQRRERIVM
jgi:hypothetical protein